MSAIKNAVSKTRASTSIAVVLALLATLVYLWMRQVTPHPAEVVIDGRVRVQVEIVDTQPLREKGLSGHAPLAPDQGMLFIFDSAQRHGFWMKDMTFPIDILWIADETIADITVNAAIPVPGVALPTYAPRVPVDKVLEVPAGFAAANGLRIGASVEIVQ